MKYDSQFNIGDRSISVTDPTYFIADIAANHDGDVERAKELIYLAKDAGADVAKFQHFKARTIISAKGYEKFQGSMSHQEGWNKSVYDVYDQYHTRDGWTETIVETCEKAGIEFMTTPYSFDAIDQFADLVPAYKVGSGDITYTRAIERMAQTGLPILLATGASDINEVAEAVDRIVAHNPKICLMQCNTNYTGSLENFRFVNLNVLRSFAVRWPNMVLGLSDHTPGHSAVLGAVALGARVVEKHFTDDNSRVGPDHDFAMNPQTWRAMVDATRELEYAMGDGVKRIEGNETDTVVIQRRALRLAEDLPAGTKISEEHLTALRPCPRDAVPPSRIDDVIGKTLATDKTQEEELLWSDLG